MRAPARQGGEQRRQVGGLGDVIRVRARGHAGGLLLLEQLGLGSAAANGPARHQRAGRCAEEGEKEVRVGARAREKPSGKRR